jgi:hypothetical protein
MNKGPDCYGNWRSNANTALNGPDPNTQATIRFAHVAAQIKGRLWAKVA